MWYKYIIALSYRRRMLIMHRTPPRPRLLTDTAIHRKITLEYVIDDIPTVRDITGAPLDNAAVDLLNNPAMNAQVVVTLSPRDPANAPLVFKYYIEKFHIDHEQHERVLEIRLAPWSQTEHVAQQQVTSPLKVVPHGTTVIFVQAIIKLVTIHDGKRGHYEIRSNAKLDLSTGIMTF
jgi:hypothetical protein